MQSGKRFEMLLDFIVKPKMDAKALEAEAKKVAEALAKTNPDVKIDTKKVKQDLISLVSEFDKIKTGSESLAKALNGMQIKLNTKEVKVAFSQLQSGLKEIKESGKDIDLSKAFSGINNGELKKFKTAFEEVSNKAKSFDLNKLSSEFSSKMNSVTENINKQKAGLAQLRVEGKKNTGEYKDLKAELRESEKEFRKLTQASESLNKSAQNLTIADKLATIGLATQGIESIANSIGTIAMPYVELDTATQKIKSLQGEAKKIAPQLREMSLEMANSLGVSAVDVQFGAYEALSAGINATTEDIKSFMEASSLLAVGGGEQVKNTTDLLSSMLNAYGESATNAMKYSDVLSATVNYGKTSIEELIRSMSMVVPTASAMGFSIEAVGGSLALMTANGIPTSRATTKLNQLLVELQKPGTQLTTILNNAGVSVESIGEKIRSGKVVEALKDVKGSFELAGKSATQAFSSTESSAAFNTLTKDFDQLQQMMDGVANSTGMTQDAFDDMGQSIEERVNTMKANIEAWTISALDAGGAFGETAVVASRMLTDLSPMLSSLTSVSTLFSGMGGKVLDYAKSLLTKLVPSLFAGTTAQVGLGTAGVASGVSTQLAWLPIIGIIAGIALAIGGIILLMDALIVTDEERLEKLNAQNEAIDKQISLNDKRKNEIETNQKLIDQYETLGKKTNRTVAEQKQFEDITLKLAKAMPGTIQATSTFAENLDRLKTKSAELNKELGDINKRQEELANKKTELTIEQSKLKINQSRFKVSSELSTGNYKAYHDAITKQLQAQTEAEIKRYADEARLVIYSDKNYKDLNEEERKAIEDHLNNMHAEAKKLLKAKSAQMQSESGKLAEAISRGLTGGLDGAEAQKQIQKIAQMTGKSVEEITDTVKAKLGAINESKFGELIKSQLDIKKATVDTAGLDDLVNKFKTAKTDAERANFAELIKKSAPEAVKYSKQIVDEQGKLIPVYEITEDKIKSASEAEQKRLSGQTKQNQEKFIKLLENEGGTYADNKRKMEELRKEIETKKKAGVDTSELEKSFYKLQGENNKFQKGLLENSAKFANAGADMNSIADKIAKSLGKSPDEVKKLIEQQRVAISTAKEQARATENIGEAWANARKENSSALDANIQEYAALSRKANKTADEVKRMNSLKVEGQQQSKQERADAKAIENAEIALGKRQRDRRSSTKKEETDINKILKDRLELLSKGTKSELDALEYNQIQTANAEKRNRDTKDEIALTQKKIELQRAELEKAKEILNERKLLAKVNEDGTIELKEDEKAINKQADLLKKKNEALAKLDKKYKTEEAKNDEKYLKEKQKIEDDYTASIAKTKSESLLDISEKYNATLKEIAQSESDLRNKQIEQNTKDWESTLSKISDKIANIETAPEIDLKASLNYNELVTELNNFEAEIAKRIEQIKYNDLMGSKEKETEIKKLVQLSKENQKKIIATNAEYYSKQIAELDNYNEKYFDKLKKSNEREYYLRTKFYDDTVKLTQEFYEALEEAENKKHDTNQSDLDKQLNHELEMLDIVSKKKEVTSWADKAYEGEKLKIQKKYNNLKEEQERKHRDKMLALQQYFNTIENEANKAKENENLKATIEGLKKKYDILKEAEAKQKGGLTAEQKIQLEETNKALADANTKLAENQDTSRQILERSGEAIGNAVTDLFAGNAEKAKQGMQALFADILGIYAKKLSAKISGVVLDLVLDWLATSPIPATAKLLLAPAINATISAGINALAKPIISKLTSFSTGGVVDKPTLAVIGDATRTGQVNKEWIFSNEQLKKIMAMSSMSSNSRLEKRLESIERLLANQKLEVHNHGDSILYAVRRTEQANSRRMR